MFFDAINANTITAYQDRMVAKIADMFLEERLTIGEVLDFLDAVRRFLLNCKITRFSIEDTVHECSVNPSECFVPSAEAAEETTTPQPDGVPPVPLP